MIQFHSYRKAILIKPDYADARWNLATILLSLGCFEEGWTLYETRFDKNATTYRTQIPDLSYPTPGQVRDRLNKSISVRPEQGMGDEIQSIRYIPFLKQLGAARVTLVCKSPLKSLFHSVPGADVVIAESEASLIGDHDFWVLQMSLPMYFKTNIDTIPNVIPYLAAE